MEELKDHTRQTKASWKVLVEVFEEYGHIHNHIPWGHLLQQREHQLHTKVVLVFLPLLQKEVVEVDFVEILHQWDDLENQDYLDYAEGFLLLWPLSASEEIARFAQTHKFWFFKFGKMDQVHQGSLWVERWKLPQS